MTMITCTSMIGSISRFCTLNNILVDSPALIPLLSSKFCEFNVRRVRVRLHWHRRDNDYDNDRNS
jgi:hypothetical protein